MKILIFIILIFCFSLSFAQPKSPFNDLDIELDSSGNYNFLVSGHFYGDGTNKSHFPANTLLANLDWMNASDADMLICLGDLFKDIRNDIPNYERSFFNKLEIPLYNAVGNHDLTDNIYQDNYGATYFYFILNNDIHVILDTEMDNGDIIDDQISLLNEVKFKVLDEQNAINNVFIYSHRTIWKDNYEDLHGLFEENTQSLSEPNFKDEVYPILKEISKRSSVYWFSGSLGPAPASFFYFPDKEHDITIIATAIRSLPRDAMLMVNVVDGKVNFETHSLTGEDLMPLENYDVNMWQEGVGSEPFNWKLVVYYIQLMLTHRYFWYGMSFALSFVLIFNWIRKRRRAR